LSKRSRHRRRKELFHRRAGHAAAPGTLTVDPQAPKPLVRLIAYDTSGECVDRELRTSADLDQIQQFVDRYPVTWINVEGLGDAEIVARIGKVFGLHPLALEDTLNDHQRSKVEQYGDHLFIVARMLEGGANLENDQLAMFLGPKSLVTFQHIVGDCFDSVRERVRGKRGIICSSGPDYLAYALLDSVVDSYFPVLELIGDEIESLEDAIISNFRGDVISPVHDVKSKLRLMRRAVWPLRDALHVLVRDPNPVIREETRVYLRDCADHTFQIIDLVETYRELASDLLDLYHSSLSNRMNEVMQVLTVIATIFIPLTFIVGVYGMNFDPNTSPWNMPELRWYYGYPSVWVAMIAVAGGLLWFFQRKGWLPQVKSRKPPPER
jgi:magnesium transporter